MKFKKHIFYLFFAGTLTSCNYLDVTPDNIPTLDYAFRTPLTAEKYLFTCYSWLPSFADPYSGNPGIAGADEIWFNSYYEYNSFAIARGLQNVQGPIIDYWQGGNGGHNMFMGIRDCNIFLDNIHLVPSMSDYDKAKMSAEAKFLKAYYHFWLMRMYGPIPIMHESPPITVTVEEVKAITREPVDQVVDYIVGLLDEAIADLPDRVQFDVEELGRITKPIAMAIKAQILVTAASPLFNGNMDFPQYRNSRGEILFNSQYDEQKWVKAADACREAIDLCHSLDMQLHYIGNTGYAISDTTQTELDLRTAMTERWNSEIIWGSTNSTAGGIQTAAYPRLFPGNATYYGGYLSVPFSIVELFYSENGVPIEEDTSWDYTNRYTLKTAGDIDKNYIKEGYTTASLNFDREPRFYAYLGFDGGRWYGHGRLTDDETFYVESRLGGAASGHAYAYSATGYLPKKVVNYLNAAQPAQWTVQRYPWPIMRLTDLYLLYAEASNEVFGPSPEIFYYLDLIRTRAGLQSIEESWRNYSNQPNKYNTKQGLRDIIRRERSIELAFEGSRFWDLRRWRTAPQVLNNPIVGWDTQQEAPETYYRPVVIFNQTFGLKDYFWPIQESEMLRNKGLIQSPGW